MFWGASVEAQSPFTFLPKEVGIKGAGVRRRRLAVGLQRADHSGTSLVKPYAGSTTCAIRASVGVGLIWNSPFGPLRFDYSFPLAASRVYDRIQQFRFGGGTKF